MSLDTPLTETADRPIVIRNSTWKLLLMSLASLVGVLGGLWMMNRSQSSTVHGEGLVALIFFGLGLLVFLLQMVTASLLLKVDSEGVHCFLPFLASTHASLGRDFQHLSNQTALYYSSYDNGFPCRETDLSCSQFQTQYHPFHVAQGRWPCHSHLPARQKQLCALAGVCAASSTHPETRKGQSL